MRILQKWAYQRFGDHIDQIPYLLLYCYAGHYNSFYCEMAQGVTTKYKGLTIPDGFTYGLDFFLTPSCYQNALASILLPEGVIRDRIRSLAHDIHKTIGDKPLTMLCVLKGAYRFFTSLVEELTIARAAASCQHPVELEFIRLQSYKDCESTGQVHILGPCKLEELQGKNVVVVDDVVDSGLSITQLMSKLEQSGVLKAWTAFLLSKRIERKSPVQEDFVAFNIPNEFIVGFGLDYNQQFRDLNHICIMSPLGIEKYRSTSTMQVENGRDNFKGP